MCELYTARKMEKNGKLENTTLINLFETALDGAESNPDGFGVFNDKGEVFKSGDKFSEKHISELVDLFKDSKYVVLHLRMATHGEVNDENSHPFKSSSGYIMSHNGVIRGVSEENGEVDSEQFLNKVDGVKESSIEDKISEAVKDCSGNFSNFFRTPKGELYYFREGSSMTFGFDKKSKLFIGFTSRHKLNTFLEKNFSDFFRIEKFSRDVEIKSPEEKTLYRFTDTSFKAIKELQISENYTSFSTGYNLSTRTYNTGYPGYKSYKVHNYGYNSYEELEDWIEVMGSRYVCKSCRGRFKERYDVLQHIRDAHGTRLPELAEEHEKQYSKTVKTR